MTKEVGLTFPLSRVKEFRHQSEHLRYGQAFHQFMRLDKCEQDREFCDRLYNASDDVARKMIDSRIDHQS
jgi:hypothetical protein